MLCLLLLLNTDCTKMTSDVSIVLDVSPTLDHGDFDTQISAVEMILKLSASGPNGTQFSYITFASTHSTVFKFGEFNSSADMIIEVNRQTRYGVSSADASEVLRYMNDEGFSVTKGSRSDARKVLVFISSGVLKDVGTVMDEIAVLKSNNVTVVAIGTGTQSNYTVLGEIASDPALVYVVGDDLYRDPYIVASMLSTVEYEFCSNV